MATDGVRYDQACKTFEAIALKNREGMALQALPYTIATTAAIVAALGSVQMVFDLDTALWFNERFVTTDVPEPKDLETFLEAGTWTWQWMEPPLGTFSFILLCLQFSRYVVGCIYRSKKIPVEFTFMRLTLHPFVGFFFRAQIQNLGIEPYTNWRKEKRAKKLSAAFPQYDPGIIGRFSKTDPMIKL